MKPAKKSLTGALCCIFGCYLIWGLQPMYWALLDHFDTMFVMCVRPAPLPAIEKVWQGGEAM